jgi:hypothetical protein
VSLLCAESAIVLDLEVCVLSFSLAIYEGVPLVWTNGGSGGPGASRKDVGNCSHVGSVDPEESMVGIVQAVHAEEDVGADVQEDTAQSPGSQKPNSTGWIKRYGDISPQMVP